MRYNSQLNLVEATGLLQDSEPDRTINLSVNKEELPDDIVFKGI